MCGICGYVGEHRPELLEPMCLVMAHRGPDDMGTWHDQAAQVGLGHRRLSIIDLSPAGHQPMGNEDGTVWISYNGEIYNFESLRRQLVGDGHRFRSRTHTEVLVHLYEKLGISFLEKLNGIFALAIWDAGQRQLILARDHAGVKPLYYWTHGSRLFFASEIKALLRVPEIPHRMRRDLVPQFLSLMWVPGRLTMLDEINKLEPGHCLVWKDEQIRISRWFSLAYEPDESVSEEEWVERVHDTFMQTTRRQMVSDVPLGAFLSGGADSSSIVSCMRQAYPDRDIRCYTAHFTPQDQVRDRFVDDYPYSQRVARLLNLQLKSFVLRPQVIELLPKMIYHLDEPDADPAILPSYLISKYAREDGTTVLLSGTGGDEVFFGYRSHKAYRQFERLDHFPQWLIDPLLACGGGISRIALGAQHPLARRLRKFRRGLSARGLHRHMELVDWSNAAVRRGLYTPDFLGTLTHAEEVPECMQKYYDDFQGRGEINRHSHILIQTFLGAHNFLYTDKMSMAASVEARVPFMDVDLMRLCARIPERYKIRGGTAKYILKRAMERYLPREVLYRPKTGFSAPLRKWIADDLTPVIDELLGEARLRRRGMFEPAAVRRVLVQNRENREDHAYLIYALLTLELWQQTFVDRGGIEQVL